MHGTDGTLENARFSALFVVSEEEVYHTSFDLLSLRDKIEDRVSCDVDAILKWLPSFFEAREGPKLVLTGHPPRASFRGALINDYRTGARVHVDLEPMDRHTGAEATGRTLAFVREVFSRESSRFNASSSKGISSGGVGANPGAGSSLHAVLTRGVVPETQASQATEAQSPLKKEGVGGAKIVSKKRRR
ncbi:hypothetical protein HOP50_04g28680 [Chloropicon primus]|uniref:Uncharacterized protein n=1 Tax=Chloropicon primus TaxID=1764295 RepID=A0A5B8MLW7_9CHLO|nr:hypothetical protein A3770_04p28700 [Chloropicon primus]UPQ99560.1 hypothetical protein HOP50_04g28680 [Chloropicon primus]|eukprot:QDZ20352.1 hypothetical protein A3770_04p28700 [Chloropicon primus]